MRDLSRGDCREALREFLKALVRARGIARIDFHELLIEPFACLDRKDLLDHGKDQPLLVTDMVQVYSGDRIHSGSGQCAGLGPISRIFPDRICKLTAQSPTLLTLPQQHCHRPTMQLQAVVYAGRIEHILFLGMMTTIGKLAHENDRFAQLGNIDIPTLANEVGKAAKSLDDAQNSPVFPGQHLDRAVRVHGHNQTGVR